MTDTLEVESLKNALAEAEEALADAERERDRFCWRGSIDDLVTHLWATLPAEKVAALQSAVAYRPLPIPPAPRAEETLREDLTGATSESENRLSELEALRHALREEERIRVRLEKAAAEKEACIRQLEARVAELATESSTNETAYSHQCHKTASFESEAEDLRRQFVAARHTVAEIGGARLEDWQALLERAETAEERVRHLEGRITLAEGDSDLFLCDRFDKSVCDAVEAVPDTLLRDWVDLSLSRSGRLTVIATAELARREARRGR